MFLVVFLLRVEISLYELELERTCKFRVTSLEARISFSFLFPFDVSVFDWHLLVINMSLSCDVENSTYVYIII